MCLEIVLQWYKKYSHALNINSTEREDLQIENVGMRELWKFRNNRVFGYHN